MKKKNKNKVSKTVQNSIPYTLIYDNGVIETKPGTFTRSYLLDDINFKNASDEDQTSMFLEYGRILNSIDKHARFQVLIHNHSVDKANTMKDILFAPQRDNLNRHRQEVNNILIDKMTEGKSNLSQDKYLVVSIDDDHVDHAMKAFDNMDKHINKIFRKLSRDHDTIPQTITERLEVLHSIYNIGNEHDFYNDVDEKGNPVFNLDKVIKSGLSSKGMIGPSGMEFHASYFKYGSSYGRVLYLSNIPTWMTTEFIAELSDIACNLLISTTYTPMESSEATNMVKNMMLKIDGDIGKRQEDASTKGYSVDLIPTELKRQQKYTRNLMDDILTRDQNVYLVTFLVAVFGDTKEELESNTKLINSVASGHLCPLKTLFFQQETAMNTALPLCLNELMQSKDVISVQLMLTTESASVFIPYTTQELHQKQGLYYGLNETSRNMIIYNRIHGKNYNGLIFGESGNGKSVLAKTEMIFALLKDPRNVVYVIDPQSEYTNLAREYGGEVIDLSPGSKTYINPLDMDIGYGDGSNPLAVKADFNISMLEIMMGKKHEIDPEGRSIITRSTQNIYRGYLRHLEEQSNAGNIITCDKDAMPTLNNLYQEILLQPEPSARTLASVLEMYAKGSLATFAHRSNVDTDARFVVYDIKKLGAGTKDLALHICLNDILNKMFANYAKGLYTWFYIDEFSLLLQSDSAAKFLSEIWLTARKWNGVPTGILQTSEDIIRTSDARKILNNTSFIRLLSLKKIDRNNLAELLSISNSQLEYITNQDFGHGLLYTGKTILPFDHTIPEDTNLYKLIDTSGSDENAIKKRFSYIS